jgi:hypothetical protein
MNKTATTYIKSQNVPIQTVYVKGNHTRTLPLLEKERRRTKLIEPRNPVCNCNDTAHPKELAQDSSNCVLPFVYVLFLSFRLLSTTLDTSCLTPRSEVRLE